MVNRRRSKTCAHNRRQAQTSALPITNDHVADAGLLKTGSAAGHHRHDRIRAFVVQLRRNDARRSPLHSSKIGIWERSEDYLAPVNGGTYRTEPASISS
jgi:hypothetical protein